MEKLQIFWFFHILALKKLAEDSFSLRRRSRPIKQLSSIDNPFFFTNIATKTYNA